MSKNLEKKLSLKKPSLSHKLQDCFIAFTLGVATFALLALILKFFIHDLYFYYNLSKKELNVTPLIILALVFMMRILAIYLRVKFPKIYINIFYISLFIWSGLFFFRLFTMLWPLQ